jgi:beta-N-acetylhexosaminidase
MAMAGSRVPRSRRIRHRLARVPTAGILTLIIACAGCSATSDGGGPQASSASPHASASRTAKSPQTAAAQSCATTVLGRMTEAQRAGQLFLVGLAGDQVVSSDARAIRAYHFGNVVFGTNTTGGLPRARALADGVQALVSPQTTANVRFFVGANQEGGEVQALRGPSFSAIPPATSQGQLQPAALQREALVWARQLRAAGVNLNLAPVMDIVPAGTAAQNQPIGALGRNFGDNPPAVAAHGVAFIRAMGEEGVAATVKHFPGLGRVRGNTDFSADVTDTVTTPDDPYLRSFRAAIGAGVPMVMVALATYTRIDPGHLAVFSQRIMEGLLRQQMRFQGVIVSDDLGVSVAAASVRPADRALDFIAAGGDLITVESLQAAETMAGAVLARANADAAFRGQVNTAALHVLAVKQAYGLLPCGSA